MMPQAAQVGADSGVRRWPLAALVAGAALISLGHLQLLPLQPLGTDFSVFWAGARTAIEDPSSTYDFAHVTGLLGWPAGPGELRPYAYPPSATLVFAPFALAPHWIAYGLFLTATLALYALGGRRLGAPWWFLLLPAVAWVAYCGQATFLIGGLVMLALSFKGRPIAAGLLLGTAAAIKPQLLVLLPVALAAQRDWKTAAATAGGGAALCALAAAAFGPASWIDWFGALDRFQLFILGEPELVADAATPYAALTRAGLDGRWSFLLAPLVVYAVWRTFRRGADSADQLLALFGGALLISPYAMGYEVGLLAPALAMYLARRFDPAWLGYAILALVAFCAGPLASLLAILALPAARFAMNRSRASEASVVA